MQKEAFLQCQIPKAMHVLTTGTLRDNGVGIARADNEGHIFIKMTNCGDKPLTVEKGKAFAQGVFLPFGITVDDDCKNERTGGLGSTDKTL